MKYSIWYIYLILLFFLFFISMAAVTGISFYFYKFSINRIINERVVIAKMLSNTIGSPFWIHQELMHIPGTIDNFLRETSKIPDVLFVRIISKENNVIEKSADKKEIGIIIQNPPVFEEKANIRDNLFEGKKIKEISLKSGAGDSLWIGISFDEIKNKILLGAVLLAESIIILFFITALSIFIVLRNFIFKPLLKLIASFDKLKNKDYDEIYIKDTGSITAEIKEVFDSFNRTVKEMENSEEKLKKSNWLKVKSMEEKISALENNIYELEKTRDNLEEKLKKFM